ncbi:hypothetical protein KI655_18680 [Vibrio sp. D404a]|uniref:hypothetical protein n=1 Tax=unclassified Vibrio TaxID=2614977 RepID=UPI0025573919|nr:MULTISPECIES: hypothetical protein [unclassified Vibrio]MDK9739325.1 hypothetical protein [Vibrio sp. D404a]MDK9797640.1 hypothetical protein [Vibrio sp. D449a]
MKCDEHKHCPVCAKAQQTKYGAFVQAGKLFVWSMIVVYAMKNDILIQLIQAIRG